MATVVINFSGNVGKTTITQHLLKPRFAKGNAKIISVETVNDDMDSDVKVRAEQFRAIIDEMELSDDLIVDIGASNAELFLMKMKESEGSHLTVSRFIVPVSHEIKQQRDTIQTVLALNDMGVEASRIHLILNKVNPNDDLAAVFDSVIGFVEDEKKCILNLDATVRYNEIYDLLRVDNELKGSTIASLAGEDPEGWRQRLRDTSDESKKGVILNRISAVRLAKPTERALNKVYDLIAA